MNIRNIRYVLVCIFYLCSHVVYCAENQTILPHEELNFHETGCDVYDDKTIGIDQNEQGEETIKKNDIDQQHTRLSFGPIIGFIGKVAKIYGICLAAYHLAIKPLIIRQMNKHMVKNVIFSLVRIEDFLEISVKHKIQMKEEVYPGNQISSLSKYHIVRYTLVGIISAGNDEKSSR